MALQDLRNMVLGAGDLSWIQYGGASTWSIKLVTVDAVVLEVLKTAAMCSAVSNGSEAMARTMIKAGCLGAVLKVCSLSLRFRTAPGEVTSKSYPTIRNWASFALDLTKSAIVSATTIAAGQHYLRKSLVEMTKEGALSYLNLDTTSATILSTALVGVGGMIYAKLLSDTLPQTSQLVHTMALSQAIHGFMPEFINPMVQKVFSTIEAVPFNDPRVVVALIMGAIFPLAAAENSPSPRRGYI